MLTDSGNILNILNYSEECLKEAGIVSARNDAEILLTHLLGIERFRLVDFEYIDDAITSEYKKLLKERAKRIPLQHITGKCFFMGIELLVKRGVFIPRPETEILVDEVIKAVKENTCPDIMDICCGLGNIAISLTKFLSDCRILAIDNSLDSIEMAEMNARRNSVAGKISFMKSDILYDTPALNHGFDLIISNPPYIRSSQIKKLEPEIQYEPIDALDGGIDGLEFYRRISRIGYDLLKESGLIAFEIGFSQAKGVCSILEDNLFEIIKVAKDLNNIDRVIIAKKSNEAQTCGTNLFDFAQGSS